MRVTHAPTHNTVCPRCQGYLMVEESQADDQLAHLMQIRCLNCGHRAEPTFQPEARLRDMGVHRRRMEEPLA